MAETEIVRYDSSIDLQNAWLKSVEVSMTDLAGIWKEAIDVLRDQMHDADNPQLAHKAAVRLSHLLTEITRTFTDTHPSQRQQTPIVVSRNPFGQHEEDTP